MRLPLLWHALRIRPKFGFTLGQPCQPSQIEAAGGQDEEFSTTTPFVVVDVVLLNPQRARELTVTLNHDGMAASLALQCCCAPLLLLTASCITSRRI